MVDIFKDIDFVNAEHIVRYLSLVSSNSNDANFETFKNNVTEALSENKIFQLKKEIINILKLVDNTITINTIKGYLKNYETLSRHSKFIKGKSSDVGNYPLHLYKSYMKGKESTKIFVSLMYDDKKNELWAVLFDIDNLVTIVARGGCATLFQAHMDPFEKLTTLIKDM